MNDQTPPEIYPMPSFPILIVEDIEASATWYQTVLSFQHIFTIPGPGGPMLVHLRWTKYADLLLRRQQAPIEQAKVSASVFRSRFSTAASMTLPTERARRAHSWRANHGISRGTRAISVYGTRMASC